MYDADKSGHIDTREFFQALQYLGLPITWENAMQVFAVIDTDRSGWLSEQEFINHYMANY